MANGYQRVKARKKIKLPGGDTMFVPVLVKANVVDQNGQETELSIDNTEANKTRNVHIDDLHPTVPVDPDGNPAGGEALDFATTLKVERIDNWTGLDLITQAQESEFLIDNTKGNDTAPPRFTTHQKTHVYRYFQDPQHPDDNGVFVDSEFVDEISVIDQNGQEHIYLLIGNPTNDEFRGGDLSGQADSNDADISMDGGGEGTADFPLRTDPFQNVINFSSKQPMFALNLTGACGWDSSGSLDLSGLPLPPGTVYNNSWLTNWSFTITSAGSEQGVPAGGPGPSVSPGSPSGSFSTFQYVGTGINAGDSTFTGSATTGGSLGLQGSVAGPPLTVGGKTIAGFVAALSIPISFSVFPFDLSNGTTGQYRVGNEIMIAGFTITVSGSPFTFNGNSYQAVGLKGPGTFQGGGLQIYCVPA